jgi:hypothetical protein
MASIQKKPASMSDTARAESARRAQALAAARSQEAAAQRASAPTSVESAQAKMAATRYASDTMSTGAGRALENQAMKVTGARVPPRPVDPAEVKAKVDRIGSAVGTSVEKAGSAGAAAVGEDATAAAAAKREEDAKVADASRAIENAVRTQPALTATETLNRELAKVPPERRGEVLKRSAASLGTLTEQLTSLDRAGTAEAVKNLAKATELAGPENAQALTGPMAQALALGRMEQKGAQANGGVGGIFRGANTHNSEREFVDGVAALGNAPGAQLFKDSLSGSLQAESKASKGEVSDRAGALAAAVATGRSDLVADSGGWTAARTAGEVALKGAKKASELEPADVAQEAADLTKVPDDVNSALADARADATTAKAYRAEAEAKLKALAATPGPQDATPILNELAEKNAQLAAKHEGQSSVYKLVWWEEMVNTGREWDLKSKDPVWKNPNDNLTYNGQPLRSDDAGNINYGYAGSAIFGDDVLKYGAGAAQAASGIVGAVKSKDPVAIADEVKRYLGSMASGGYGDNTGDAAAIQRGINAYHLAHQG